MRRTLTFLLALWATLLCGSAWAQADPTATAPVDEATSLPLDARGWPIGEDPGRVADEAIAVWLEQTSTSLTDLAGRSAEEVCEALPGLVSNPPPPEGTRVRIEERLAVPIEGDDDRAAFTYAAVRSGDLLDVVRVDLRRDGETWQVERVGFRVDASGSGRAWLQTPAASIGFAVLTLLTVLSLIRPSPLRRALARSIETIRRHRRTVLITMGALYATFIVGVLAGASLPDACDAAVLTVVQNAVAELGAVEAYASGDVARAAVVTFYQNFVVVTFSVHFLLSLLMGAPTYLVAVPQFFLLGLPFGLLADTAPLALVPVVVLVGIELTAYFLVVSGGGIVLGTLFRRGFGAYPEAVRQAASLLVPAGLLLLAGAWYEAIVLIIGS
jgi:hypothetical protein